MQTEGADEQVKNEHKVSRREFLGGAGAAAGTLMTLGSTALLPIVPTVAVATTASAGFGLELDGQYVGDLLKASGGDPRLDFQPGRSPESLVQSSPLKLVTGLSMTKVFHDWVASAASTVNSRNLAVIGGGFEASTSYRLVLRGARITEVLLSQLDGADATTPVTLALTVVAEASSHQYPASPAPLFPGTVGAKPPPLLGSNFRLYIQGLEAETAYVAKIESLGMRAVPTATLIATKTDLTWATLPLEFDVSMIAGRGFYGWLTDTLNGKKIERAGVLQLLSADRTKVMASVDLQGLGITRAARDFDANAERLARLRVSCYCRGLKFNFAGLGV